MPVVQPVLETVTNTYILYIYIYIYTNIVGKSVPINNYEQYKRSNKSNHWETIPAHIYIGNQEIDFFLHPWVCVCGYL